MSGMFLHLCRKQLRPISPSLGFLLLLYFLPGNREWVLRIQSYFAQIPRHLSTRDYDQVMSDRLGPNYSVLRDLQEEGLRPADILLLPPIEYISATFDPVYCNWVEPKFFYYVLGPQPFVTLGSPNVRKATATVFISADKEPVLVRFDSNQARDGAIEILSGWRQ